MLKDEQVATATWRVTPDPMCILDRQGRFAALNPAWRDVLGWSRSEMQGRSYLDFLHPDDVARSTAAFDKVLRGKPVLRFENRYVARDGSYRWLSWVAVPEDDHFFCTVRDITEEKRREQVIEDQRNEALVQKQFLAILGHDLRNPLAAVTAGVRLLSRHDLPAEAEPLLRNMASSSFRMSELIENLMDLTRLQLGGGIAVERRPVDALDPSLRQIASEIQSAHDDATVRPDIELSGPVHCDEPRLLQVVSNLLGNAVAHGASGAPVDMIVRNTGGTLSIAVCNTGPAIPEDLRDTLFQPFFRNTAEGTRASANGLGLGLYICKEIITAHGGEIDVTSDADTTCFTVTIPDS